MRMHAIQTGTVAIKERQRSGVGRGPLRQINTLLDPTWTAGLPIHAWVIEHPEGLIVIDTGEVARATAAGYFPQWNPYYRLGVRLTVQPEEEIGPQLRALGLSPADVRWVVLTHLHTDHAGGLAHFPRAEILLSRREYDDAAGLHGQLRGSLPQHWPAWFAPRLIHFADGPLGPFAHSHTLTRAGDVSLVPTPGHTLGHMSVVVQHDGIAWLFAGDTSYTERLMLEGALDGVSADVRAARQTFGYIQQLARATPTVYLPSHDPDSATRLAGRQLVARIG